MNEKIKRLLELALELNEKTEDSYFFSYSGHTNTVDLYIYKGGWDEEKDQEYLLFCHSFELDDDEVVDGAIDVLEARVKEA